MGVLVWILSEWVPMLIFMFVVILFNVDLVSGNFAQLLAISNISIRGELGAVHIAIIKIYHFLYGMWNLDFLGVFLPPYIVSFPMYNSHCYRQYLAALLHWAVPTNSGHHTHSAGEVCRKMNMLSSSGPMPQTNVTMEGKILRWHVL